MVASLMGLDCISISSEQLRESIIIRDYGELTEGLRSKNGIGANLC